jgi:hypothetical protein
MSKLTELVISIEVRGEDLSDETRRTVELQVARLAERLEAVLAQDPGTDRWLRQICPGLKISVRGGAR